MSFAFEKLIVYQKSVAFADTVCTLTKHFPRGYFFLADQLNRAALSIAANIAEGNGRFTKADRKHFFGIAARERAGVCPTLGVGCASGIARSGSAPATQSRPRRDRQDAERPYRRPG